MCKCPDAVDKSKEKDDTEPLLKTCKSDETHCVLAIKQITFEDNHKIDKDTLGDFGSPEWINGRAEKDQSPVCYTRKKKVKLTAVFKVTTKPSKDEQVKITGASIFDAQNLEWTCDVTVQPTDTEITTTAMTSSKTLPDYVGYYNKAAIKWGFNPANCGLSDAGTSEHLFYVTLADPAGVKAYWTILDISCPAAHKQNDEDVVVEKIYEAFKKGLGTGNGLIRRRDNKKLQYWAKGYETQNKPLLEKKPEGRCGNWASCLLDTFKTHGITDGKDIIMVRSKSDFSNPDSSTRTGFLVKHWSFSGSGSLPIPFTHKVLSECKPEDGIKAQGIDNSQPFFYDHVTVKRKDEFFDPSYGVGPFKNLMEYEKAAFAGLGYGFTVKNLSNNDLIDSEKNKIYAPNTCSKGYVEYIIKKGDTLSKIAKMFGVGSYMDLFKHTYNEEFRKDPKKSSKTRDPDLIKPGEKLYIPFELANKINMLKFYYIGPAIFGSILEEKYIWH